jgi:hypothetical protein
MVAVLIKTDSPLNIARILPGQGKTYVIMLLSQYYRKRHPNKKVLVLSSTPLLVKQLHEEISTLV